MCEIANLTSPALVLDEAKMMVNIQRMTSIANRHGVALRPHIKTAKSDEIIRRLIAGNDGRVTASTLAEAERCFDDGISDILYAVGIAPQKIPRVQRLRARGCELSVILDSEEQAAALCNAVQKGDEAIPAYLEIESSQQRSGLNADNADVVKIGKKLVDGGGELRGVIIHAGESYTAFGTEEHARIAEQERTAALTAANALRQAGIPCPEVSIGSSPTAHAARDLTGITELRAGVYVFFDLVMAKIGTCTLDDIAISVLTTVIGQKRDSGSVVIDAGWMALSLDRGAGQVDDYGYGLVCDVYGQLLPGLVVTKASQEHGTITFGPSATTSPADLPIGTMLRILPIHACATATQHAFYNVIPEAGGPLETWQRFGGW